MGTSVDMIDRTYGHLARGSEANAGQKLDDLAAQSRKKSERLGVDWASRTTTTPAPSNKETP